MSIIRNKMKKDQKNISNKPPPQVKGALSNRKSELSDIDDDDVSKIVDESPPSRQ